MRRLERPIVPETKPHTLFRPEILSIEQSLAKGKTNEAMITLKQGDTTYSLGELELLEAMSNGRNILVNDNDLNYTSMRLRLNKKETLLFQTSPDKTANMYLVNFYQEVLGRLLQTDMSDGNVKNYILDFNKFWEEVPNYSKPKNSFSQLVEAIIGFQSKIKNLLSNKQDTSLAEQLKNIKDLSPLVYLANRFAYRLSIKNDKYIPINNSYRFQKNLIPQLGVEEVNITNAHWQYDERTNQRLIKLELPKNNQLIFIGTGNYLVRPDDSITPGTIRVLRKHQPSTFPPLEQPKLVTNHEGSALVMELDDPEDITTQTEVLISPIDKEKLKKNPLKIVVRTKKGDVALVNLPYQTQIEVQTPDKISVNGKERGGLAYLVSGKEVQVTNFNQVTIDNIIGVPKKVFVADSAYVTFLGRNWLLGPMIEKNLAQAILEEYNFPWTIKNAITVEFKASLDKQDGGVVLQGINLKVEEVKRFIGDNLIVLGMVSFFDVTDFRLRRSKAVHIDYAAGVLDQQRVSNYPDHFYNYLSSGKAEQLFIDEGLLDTTNDYDTLAKLPITDYISAPAWHKLDLDIQYGDNREKKV